jgi:hypothetical protein
MVQRRCHESTGENECRTRIGVYRGACHVLHVSDHIDHLYIFKQVSLLGNETGYVIRNSDRRPMADR